MMTSQQGMKMTTFTTKLGRDGTRFWIEGSRLTDHGFKFGTFVKRTWGKGSLILTPCTETQFNNLERANRSKVSGTGSRPLIDITAQIVADTFGVERVNVTFSKNKIEVTK
jgi:hypothetical protein